MASSTTTINVLPGGAYAVDPATLQTGDGIVNITCKEEMPPSPPLFFSAAGNTRLTVIHSSLSEQDRLRCLDYKQH